MYVEIWGNFCLEMVWNEKLGLFKVVFSFGWAFIQHATMFPCKRPGFVLIKIYARWNVGVCGGWGDVNAYNFWYLDRACHFNILLVWDLISLKSYSRLQFVRNRRKIPNGKARKIVKKLRRYSKWKYINASEQSPSRYFHSWCFDFRIPSPFLLSPRIVFSSEKNVYSLQTVWQLLIYDKYSSRMSTWGKIDCRLCIYRR